MIQPNSDLIKWLAYTLAMTPAEAREFVTKLNKVLTQTQPQPLDVRDLTLRLKVAGDRLDTLRQVGGPISSRHIAKVRKFIKTGERTW